MDVDCGPLTCLTFPSTPHHHPTYLGDLRDAKVALHGGVAEEERLPDGEEVGGAPVEQAAGRHLRRDGEEDDGEHSEDELHLGVHLMFFVCWGCLVSVLLDYVSTREILALSDVAMRTTELQKHHPYHIPPATQPSPTHSSNPLPPTHLHLDPVHADLGDGQEAQRHGGRQDISRVRGAQVHEPLDAALVEPCSDVGDDRGQRM